MTMTFICRTLAIHVQIPEIRSVRIVITIIAIAINYVLTMTV